ncbi:hypothetical protein, partial [Listeria monocytogenes]|uniref:hypothetical protein n=1 Tax=Listeria monocytogenes TaxID=1639 RepID=UPI001A9C83A1
NRASLTSSTLSTATGYVILVLSLITARKPPSKMPQTLIKGFSKEIIPSISGYKTLIILMAAD